VAEAAFAEVPLPVAARRRDSVGWWGVLCLIATESALFAYLLFSYYYIATQLGPAWSPEPHPSIALSGPNTLILLSSSIAVWWGEAGVKKNDRRQHLLGVGLAIGLGLVFLIVQVFEWRAKAFTLSSGAYGSLFFTITGFHMAHVIAGVIMLSVVFVWSAMGLFNPRRHAPVSVAATYWHFVDAVWLAVFFTFYVTPYLWRPS
jgi:cytochrome c oxidase subunit III